MEGSVYTISPRLIIPTNSVNLPKGVARQFWLTVKVPPDAAPGVYQAMVTVSPEHGPACSAALTVTVRKGTLDPARHTRRALGLHHSHALA